MTRSSCLCPSGSTEAAFDFLADPVRREADDQAAHLKWPLSYDSHGDVHFGRAGSSPWNADLDKNTVNSMLEADILKHMADIKTDDLERDKNAQGNVLYYIGSGSKKTIGRSGGKNVNTYTIQVDVLVIDRLERPTAD